MRLPPSKTLIKRSLLELTGWISVCPCYLFAKFILCPLVTSMFRHCSGTQKWLVLSAPLLIHSSQEVTWRHATSPLYSLGDWTPGSSSLNLLPALCAYRRHMGWDTFRSLVSLVYGRHSRFFSQQIPAKNINLFQCINTSFPFHLILTEE